ncbi:MAG: acyl-ACP--UDP-N-acetylglucosamine O-acyltransferase [Phycisphaerales bacterium]
MSSTAIGTGVRIHPTASVHPTAFLEGDVEIGAHTVVGPGCVVWGLVGPVRVGAHCQLLVRCNLTGPLVLGDRNILYPNVSLGFSPQDVGFDPNSPGPGCIIGDGNTFRENVTIHRGKTAEPTRIGNSNYWMTNSHVGHDSVVGNNCIIATNSALAGHVEIADRVIFGGVATIHQFTRVGRGAMLGGLTGISMDLPPFFMTTSINLAGSINLVGLRRSGASVKQIDTVRWVYKTIYRSGSTPQQALPILRERAGDPLVDEYIAFIASSKRGICHGAGRTSRGHGGARNATPEAP